MNQYHVWITEQKEWKAIETTGVNSPDEVTKLLSCGNWYGCEAEDEKEAIQIAKSNGFRYRSPKEMLGLESRVKEFLVESKS